MIYRQSQLWDTNYKTIDDQRYNIIASNYALMTILNRQDSPLRIKLQEKLQTLNIEPYPINTLVNLNVRLILKYEQLKNK